MWTLTWLGWGIVWHPLWILAPLSLLAWLVPIGDPRPVVVRLDYPPYPPPPYPPYRPPLPPR